MFQPGVDFPEGTRICEVQLRNGSDLLEGVVGYDPAAEVSKGGVGIVLLILQDSLVLPNQRKVVCEGGLSAPHHSAPGLSRLRGSGVTSCLLVT